MSKVRVFVLFTCVLWAPASVFSWDPPFFTGDPARLRSEALRLVSKDSDLTVLFEETRYSFDAQGRRTYRYRTVFIPRTAELADAWGEVSASFAPWHQSRPLIRARVISPDLKVHTLDLKTIAEEPAAADGDRIYSDRRVLRGPLPGITAGAVVEQEIEVADNQAFFEGGSVYRHRAYSGFPVLDRRLIVVSPAGRPARVEPREGAPPVTTTTNASGEIETTVRIENAERELPSTVGAPPDVAFGAHYLVATGESWQDVASRYSRIIDERIAGADVSDLTRGLSKGVTAQDAARVVLKNLKDLVRYSGIEFGQASIVPWTPAQVLERRYGDCKDQASILVAAFRALGLSASVALLRTDWSYETDPQGPGLGDFNHAIVALRDADRLIWIDSTVDEPRIDMLPVPDQGRMALIADPRTTGLVRTSETRSTDNRVVETRIFELPSHGSATVTERSEYFGGSTAQHPSYTTDTKPEDLASLKNYAEREYLSKDVSVEAAPPSTAVSTRTFQMKVKGARRGAVDTSEAVVAVRPSTFVAPFADSIAGDAPAGQTEPARELEYLFWEPFTYEWRYRIQPPRGFVPTALPPSAERKLGTATLKTDFKVAPDGSIQGTFLLDSGPRRISAGDFDATRKALRALKAEDAILIRMKHPAEAALEEGNLPEAIAGFRRNLTESADGHTRARYARALLAAGFGEAARVAARRAVSEAPQESEAHAALGWILQHDLFGRRFAPGSDLSGAEAAHRKSIEISGDRDDYKTDLAILLEHEISGRRYRNPARLKEAIAIYEPIKERLTIDNLGIAYVFAGDYKAAEKELSRTPSTLVRNAWLITAAALRDGFAAALAKAGEVAPSLTERRPAIEAAAQNLPALRRWDLASQLNTEAAKGSPNSTGILSRAALQKRIARHDGAARPVTDPVGLAQEYVRRAARRDHAGLLALIDPAALAPARPQVAEADDETNDSLERASRRLGSAVRAFHTDTDVALDLFLSLSEFFLEGNERTGFRVRMKAVEPAQTQSFLIRSGPSGLRVITAGHALTGAGLEVLGRLDRKDMDGAAQWLDWSRETTGPDAGADPLGQPLIQVLWGQELPRTEAQARLAAAVLIAGDLPQQALQILEPALKSAPSVALQRGVLGALMEERRLKEADVLLADLAGRYPASLAGFAARTMVALLANEPARAEALVRAWIRDRPADGWGLRLLASVAEHRGDVAAATAAYKQLIATEFAAPMDYNNLAWEGLFTGEPLDTLLDWARRAVDQTRSADPGLLNTLATLYAEGGSTRQALELVWRSMEIDGGDDPRPEDHYVIGRMAEAYQLNDIARESYAKVPEPRSIENRATSVKALAERRLKTLK